MKKTTNILIIMFLAVAFIFSNPLVAEAKSTSKCAVSGCTHNADDGCSYCFAHRCHHGTCTNKRMKDYSILQRS